MNLVILYIKYWQVRIETNPNKVVIVNTKNSHSSQVFKTKWSVVYDKQIEVPKYLHDFLNDNDFVNLKKCEFTVHYRNYKLFVYNYTNSGYNILIVHNKSKGISNTPTDELTFQKYPKYIKQFLNNNMQGLRLAKIYRHK
jgi:hypothetical protein